MSSQLFSLDGRKALVTGASRGIGCDAARYITGVCPPVDGGTLAAI